MLGVARHGIGRAAHTVDHVIPIREVPQRRIDATNLQPCAGRATTTKSIPAMAISVTVTANQIKKPNDWFSTFSEPVEVTSMPRRTSKKPRPSKAQAECPLVDADGVMSPYLSIMNRATPLISKLAAQMGFRPVARTTLCADDDVS